VRLRDALLATTGFVLLYLPFLNHGRIPIGSLGAYLRSFRFNDPVFAVFERVVPSQVVAAFAALLGILISIWFRARNRPVSPDAFSLPMAASLLFAPVVYPWYLLWLLPFVRSISTLPLILWTVSIIPTYLVWHFRVVGRPWVLPGWIVLVEYGSVAIAAAIVVVRRRIRRTG